MGPLKNIGTRALELYAKRYDPEGVHEFANAYWGVLLALMFMSLVGAMLYGEQTLYGVLKEIDSAQSAGLPPPPIDRAQLDATVSEVRTRQSAFDTMRTNLPAVPSDPSN